jgi:hemerythrin-like domain-containing protein
MAEMSMNKAIHGAVRRDLRRFVDALADFQPGDTRRAKRLHAAWTNFQDQLHHHHRDEHAIAWPALAAVGVPHETIATMDAEHDAMAAALDEADAAMERLSRAPNVGESRAALAAVKRLQTVTVDHLDHEEAEIEPVLLAKHDTPEMKAMGREFGKVSPMRGGRFFAWVLDGATPQEQAAVRGEVPGPVLAIIGGIFGLGYRRRVAPVWR